ncbi:MAG: pilus assembly PilX N-terminal domain-containing protein, partial [Desulfosudaceae bacterium]
MKILFSGNIGNNQDGSMIVIAILLVALLTIVGVASMDDALVENRIAVNDQLKKIALYHADSGTSALVPKLLRTWLVDGKNGDIGSLQPITYDESAGEREPFFEQVYGAKYDDGLPDVGYQFANGEMASDVER